uniref:ZP domain-containing protein n=1 Tax=Haemonchus contortus TaxID=6289 RepID=A0A7I4Y896_HAECO
MSFCQRIVFRHYGHLTIRLLPVLFALVYIPFVVGGTEESRLDNTVIGVPLITCERDRVVVTVTTSRPFAGKIFVKGEYAKRECMRAYMNGFPIPSDEALLSPNRKGPPSSDEKLEGGSASLEGSMESGGDYLDSVEKLPSPEQASRFLNEADLSVSDRAKSPNVHQNMPGSAEYLTSSEWSGHGGASSSNHKGQPYVGAFGGSLREEVQSGMTSGLKVYDKPKAFVPEDLPKYPGPQGMTSANCPMTCEPCVCPKEQRAQERRRRDTNTVELSVPLGACNTKRDRKVSPPTLSVSFVAVVSFHESFITKLDRAYRIQCAYVETNKSLTTQLDVGTLNPSQLNGTAPSPVCGYHISGANGQQIQNVRVGDQVKHEWICTTPAPKLYSMLIHSCYVEDGAGQRYQVIDENGCSLDHYILNTPRYDSDRLTATVDAFMMKFPDRSAVDFQCSIQVCSKLDKNCTGISPPDCSALDEPNKRRRRAAPVDAESMTIHANSLTVLDADTTQEIPHSLALTSEPWIPSEFCLSIAGFGILVSASTFLATVSFGMAVANAYIKVNSTKW